MRTVIVKYPFTICLLIAIWVLCFINIPETPLSHISLIDKWTHMAMYLVLSLAISFERIRSGTKEASSKRLLLWGWLLPTLMGGLIEVLQAYCTDGRRSGEWLDFAADAIGTTIALAIGTLLVKWRTKV